MTTKQTRPKPVAASQFNALAPLIKAKLVLALEASTPVQQMELIEWLAAETPEEKSQLEVPSLLKRLTVSQKAKLIEQVTASMLKAIDTAVCLPREGDVKEFNVQEWLEEKG